MNKEQRDLCFNCQINYIEILRKVLVIRTLKQPYDYFHNLSSKERQEQDDVTRMTSTSCFAEIGRQLEQIAEHQEYFIDIKKRNVLCFDGDYKNWDDLISEIMEYTLFYNKNVEERRNFEEEHGIKTLTPPGPSIEINQLNPADKELEELEQIAEIIMEKTKELQNYLNNLDLD